MAIRRFSTIRDPETQVELIDVDPSVAGWDAPEGMMAYSTATKTVYVKTSGPPTSWSLVGPVVASWSATGVRTFLYDPVNGDDANLGYSDVAGPYDPTTQAKKTLAGLASVFPTVFRGRTFRLLIASGAIANNDLDLLLAGAVGIGSSSLVRATGTNATASATAFADDTNDRTFCGATTATNASAGGYNPTAGSTTTSVLCQLNGGGSANLSAEPASPLMWRIRFDSSTPTATLRNVCRAVIQVAGGNAVTLDSALPAVPATNDVFYLEMAGLSFSSIRVGGFTIEPTSSGGSTTGLQFVGIRTASSVVYGEGIWSFTFCGGGATTVRSQYSQSRSTYFDPLAAVTLTVGGGYRAEGLLGVIASVQANWLNCYGTSITMQVYGQGAVNGVCGTSGFFVGPGNPNGLATGTSNPLRILGAGPKGGIEVWNYLGYQDVAVMTVTITGCGAKPAISVRRSGGQVVLTSGVTGSTGNTDVGLDLTEAYGATVVLRSVPTVTGTAGDVRMGDGTIVSWATAAAGVKDNLGNRIYQPGHAP